jgi:hypothetical protein
VLRIADVRSYAAEKPGPTSLSDCLQKTGITVTDPLQPPEQAEVQRQVSEFSRHPIRSLNYDSSASADVHVAPSERPQCCVQRSHGDQGG